MHERLGSRARRHARLIIGVTGAAVLLTGGTSLAASDRPQAVPAATPPGVSLEDAGAFVAITPTRVMDTRQVGQTVFGQGETRTLSFGSWVPPEATAVALSIVSASGATATGYFTMWPAGEARPETSVVNPVPEYDLATSALLRLGDGQGISVYNAFGEAHLIVDLLGYFVPMSDVGDGSGAGSVGGAHILAGSGAPTADIGADGDFYLDTTTGTLYGPKTGGAWPPTGTPIGEQGAPDAGTQVYGTGVSILSVLGTDPILFDETPRAYGGGVGDYDPATGELTLAAAGTYRISYHASATVGLVTGVAVAQNGTEVPGSESGGLLAVSDFNGDLLVTAAAGDVLQLVYDSTIGVNTTFDASMLVERVG